MNEPKCFCTIKTFTTQDGHTYELADHIWAESFDQATMFCNDDYNEYVVGEIVEVRDC